MCVNGILDPGIASRIAEKNILTIDVYSEPELHLMYLFTRDGAALYSIEAGTIRSSLRTILIRSPIESYERLRKDQ